MNGARRARPPVLGAASSLTVRLAGGGDAAALDELAELSGAERPAGEALVAEVDGRLWAALPLGGELLADPFRPTAEVAALLRLRAKQLR